MTLFKEDESLNTHAARLERLVHGALTSAIDAHGPVTKALVGSVVKRVVGQLKASAQTRVPIPVVTAAQIERLERLADRFDALHAEMMDGALAELSSSLAVLRDENHPEGWTTIEIVERADVPLAVLHHYTIGKAPKSYRRKRDGNTVNLQPLEEPESVSAVDLVGDDAADPSTRA